MALSFGENLGVLGNIKLTDVKLVAGAFRTIASGSDTGSITVQRVEDGQIIYIQSEDRLIKATKSGASVNWSDFSFPSSGSTGNFETITVGGGTFTSASLASGGVSSFGALSDVPSGIVSASVLSSPSQGTIRLATNGNNTDVDSGLQSGDTPTFAGLVIQGNVSASGDIIAENYILKSSVTEVTTSFSSGSTIFGDTFNDTHQFTGSLFSSGSVTAPSFSGIFIGALSSSAQISTDISGSFTSVSSSLDTRLTNATASIAGLKTDSGSFDTRLTNATSSIAGLKVDSGSFDTRITNATSSIAGLKTDSGSFSTRATTLETTMVSEQANIDTLQSRVGQSLNTSDSPTFSSMTLTGDLIAQNFIVSSSVTHMTQSFSSGSTIFGDTLNDTHLFTGSLNVTGSITASGFTGDGSGLTNVFENTAASQSISSRLTNSTSSIAGLKVDSGSFSTRVTTLENTPGGIFQPTGSVRSTTNNLQVTGSFTVTNTGSFGVLKQNNQIVASPTIFNVNQTNALEVDGNGDIQFVNSNFSESKFLVDADFELDENGDFQQKIKLGDYFGTS